MDNGSTLQTKRRVLIITFYFPPRAGVASLRLKGLAKYLPEFGWEPVILTPQLPGRPEPRFRVIETLYPGDVAEQWSKRLAWLGIRGGRDETGVFNVQVRHELPLFKQAIGLLKRITRTLIYPDNQKPWYPYALATARSLLTTETFDAIISSYGPAAPHLTAKALKLEFGLPWVADFRDLWTQNPYYNHLYFCGPIRKAFEERLERSTLSVADALVTVSEPLAERLKSLHKGKRVEAIPNGFDPDEVPAEKSTLTKEMSLIYTGNLYEGMQDPTPLFHALSEMINEGSVRASEIKVSFYGSRHEWLLPIIEKLGLKDVVTLNRPIARGVILEEQRKTHILLLIDWKDKREQGIYTGKLFEYLAARRPILAFGGGGGVIAKLLQETGAGRYATDVKDMKKILLEWYREYKELGEVVYKGNWEAVEKYSHRSMAQKFASLLDAVTRGRQ